MKYLAAGAQRGTRSRSSHVRVRVVVSGKGSGELMQASQGRYRRDYWDAVSVDEGVAFSQEVFQIGLACTFPAIW
jgi:hypothetical protein